MSASGTLAGAEGVLCEQARRPRVKGMPWRAINMMVYLIQHDARHRGQITALARALGHRLSSDDVMNIWEWKKLS